ncbi:hypothetical protein EKO27_g8152 [Xylaria grammica]|uniref:Ecp2 effector protein domain-containing protein n=1 Tax=Xylaria grammica TaxID=363999 RepID=A0A439CXL0_9PEZI|nr:hypothetical protein F5X98DRAFT_388135 [Xylaria grammica]RWA06952.1 hypothetical protein EKO27_g8152 [Xylaria grammica]GAW20370.1 hypothetical protein ANO14919_098750 [Xylariales sp. No.14919]
MRANILFALAASLLLTYASPVHPKRKDRCITMALYQDNDCQIPVPGTGNTTVNAGTCDTNVKTGWLSAIIIANNELDLDPKWPHGPEFYERNNCAVGQKRHGYSGKMGPCLRNFGFVANAVGLW